MVLFARLSDTLSRAESHLIVLELCQPAKPAPMATAARDERKFLMRFCEREPQVSDDRSGGYVLGTHDRFMSALMEDTTSGIRKLARILIAKR